MASLLHSFIKMCNPDPSKAGKTLLVLNALGMVFAAASNTVAAAKDKNTSQQDKKFLVPAGAITGVANIGLYYTMTDKMIKGLQKTAKKIGDSMSQEDLNKSTLAFVDKQISKATNGFLGTGLFKKSDDYIASMKSNLLKNPLKSANIKENTPTKEAIKCFKEDLKGGAGVLGAFIGAVVGCAILTPVIRDVSAYLVQKRMEKNNPEMQNKPFRPYFDPAHIESGRYGKIGKQPLTMKSYMNFTNGSMKI